VRLGDGMRVVGGGGCCLAWLSCGCGRCGGVCVVARAWCAYSDVVAAACVMGPVVGVLSWSSGCGATP